MYSSNFSPVDLVFTVLRYIVLFLQTGMDQRLWKQAQADNPDPENYIPVPMIGFSEVSWENQPEYKSSFTFALLCDYRVGYLMSDKERK